MSADAQSGASGINVNQCLLYKFLSGVYIIIRISRCCTLRPPKHARTFAMIAVQIRTVDMKQVNMQRACPT